MGSRPIAIVCARCGAKGTRAASEINRARRLGAPLYCTRRCAGLARRKHKTKAQKIKEKRLYDIEYRKRNLARLLAQKRDYFKRTYDPAKAAIARKKRMHLHVAYCQRPEYKKWKQQYDRQFRSKKNFGPFAEAAMLVVDLNREIKGRMSNHEIKWKNKTCNKATFRDRENPEAARYDARPRHRDRRDRHKATVGA